MKRNLALATVAAASALALAFATPASAITYTLTTGNADISAYPGPYGTVAVNLLTSTTASVIFTAGSVAPFNYFFIDSSVADVNVNASSWTIGSLVTNGLNSPALTNGGSGTVDGFGVFNQTLNQFDGYNDRATTISFVLTDVGGTWANSASVLTPNASGFFVAAHIAVCDTRTNPTCNSDPGAVATGFATNGRVPIPEPATWGLMLVGFGGLGAVLRAKRRRQRLAIA